MNTAAGMGRAVAGSGFKVLLPKPTLAFSTWFAIAEQGMKDLEILNRASAVIVPARSPSFRAKYHFITCSHVAAPWLWPKYYSDPWLQSINETHTHYTCELRHDDGNCLLQEQFVPQVFHHHKLDLCALHLEPETEASAVELFKSFGVSICDLWTSEHNLKEGHPISVSGHELLALGPKLSGQDEDTRLPIPRLCSGKIFGSTLHQNFAKTHPVLTEGMCGGPVFVEGLDSADSGDQSEKKKKTMIYGMIDGIVPHTHPNAELAGLASYISGPVIRSFLKTIEDGLVEPLVGGHAARHVGSDLDPTKLDIENIIRKYT